MGTVRDAEIKVILELTDLLNKNADKVTSGETKVCLTTSSLTVLASNFRRYSDTKDRQTDSPEAGSSSWIGKFRSKKVTVDHGKWRESVRTLFDFIIKIKSLKIILGSNTLRAPVQIARFRSLHVLEVKKVPIHMLEGLSKLRGQLTEIIVTRSAAQTLQDILEICGGDRSSGFVWSNLKSVHVSFNGFKHLDNSLRFIPFVEVLDLSHNSIQKSEDYLQHLTDISQINFGFNMLQSVPQFSYSNRGKLKTLVLRNNNLESLEGIQEMHLLEELDLTENCLIDHSVLHVLTSLDKLTVLYLIGNPLYYISNHRQKTVNYLSTHTRMKEFSLDGQALSAEEIMVIKKNRYKRETDNPDSSVTIVHDPPSRDDPLVIPRTPTIRDKTGDQLSPGTPHSEKKKRGHRRIKSRERVAKIADMSDSFTESYINETTLPTETSQEEEKITAQIEEEKKNIELMRKHYKDDWLKALSADQGKVYPEPGPDHPKTQEYEDGKQEDGTNKEADETNVPKIQPVDEKDNGKSVPALKIEPSIHTEIKEQQGNSHSSEAPPHPGAETAPDVQVTSPTVKIEQTTDIYAFSRMESTETALASPTKTFDDSAELYGEESDPFIVMLPEEDMNHLIVTVNNRYIIEKNLNGVKREALDLKFLQDYQLSDEQLSGKDIIGGISFTVVTLKFDYARKDMRERRYAMEDQSYANKLETLLSSHLKKDDEDLVECLKCQYQFPRSEAKSSPLPTCPKCRSKMLIKVEHSAGDKTREIQHKQQMNAESKFTPSFSPKASPKLQRRSAYKRSRHKQKDTLVEDGLQPDHAAVTSHLPSETDQPVEDLPSNGLSSNNTSWSDIQKAAVTARHSVSSVESDITVLASQSNKSGTSLTQSTHEIIQEQGTSPVTNGRDFEQEVGVANQSSLGAKTSSSASIEIQSASLKEQMESFGWIKDKTDQLTPVGSPLSNSVCSSMISSVYENTLPSPTGHQAGDGSGESFTSSSTDSVSIRHRSSSHGRSRSRNRNAMLSNINIDELDGQNITNHNNRQSSRSPVPSLNVSDTDRSVPSIYDTVSDSTSLEWSTDLSKTSPNVSRRTDNQSYHSSPLKNGGLGKSPNRNTSFYSEQSDNQNQSLESVTGLSDFPTDVSPIKRNSSRQSSRKGNRSGVVMDTGHWPEQESVFKNVSEVSLNVSHKSDVQEGQNSANQSGSSNTNPLPWEQDTGDKPHGGVNMDEFRNVDHRIQLYLELKVFQADEVCQCAIQCDIVQYMNNEAVKSLLVISTHRLLIFRIDSDLESDQSADWLKCYEDQPIAELRYIDIGLGYQSLRIEFKTVCSSFTLLIADESRCKNFLALLSDIIHNIDHYKLEGISKSNPVTLQNVDTDILLHEEPCEDEIQTLVRYLIVRYNDEESDTDAGTLMGVAVTNTDLVLINENHQWPLPRLQAPLSDSMKNKQFTVIRREKINNIESLMFNEYNPKELRLSFFETSDANSRPVWMISMETTGGVKSFVDAIRDPWEEEFGVSLDVTSTSFTDDSTLSKQ